MTTKRFLALLVALTMLLTLLGCAQKEPAAATVEPGTVKKVLIVIDMQKDFVDGSLGTAEAVAIVPAVVEKINEYKAAGDTIIYTLDTHDENYLNTQEGKNLPVEHCIKGTPGHDLDAAVKAAMPDDAIVIEKPTFGSYKLVDQIGEYTKTYGEENVQVELVGLCTDICVASNALLLKAAYYEMPMSVDSKCCAGVTPETHDAALTTMTMCQIAVK